jgi:hypothetical protein
MGTKAYFFLALSKEAQIPFPDQKSKIKAFAAEIGLRIDEIFIENRSPLSLPFTERQEGAKIMASLKPGDAIICLKAEWILATPRAAADLLSTLRKTGVSLYSVDLQENLSLDSKRKLVVSSGPANIVQQLLHALALASEEPLVRVNELLRSEVEDLATPESQSENNDVEYTQSAVSDQSEEGEDVVRTDNTGEVVPEHLVAQCFTFGWQKDDDEDLARERQQRFMLTEIHKMKEQGLAEQEMTQVLRDKHGIWLSSEGIRKILLKQERAVE